MIVTPKALEQRAEFYHQIGLQTEAGLSLVQSLRSLSRSGRSQVFGQPIASLLDGLEGGLTFSESASRIAGWLPSMDLALFDAGERSGRLDVCFRVLAEFYRQRAQAAREVIRQLFYPYFILHFAVLLWPFPELFLKGDLPLYLSKVGSVLAPIYLLTALVAYAAQGKHGLRVRRLLEGVFSWIPLLGAAQASLAISRFCMALQTLLAAGTQVVHAWRMAAEASGSSRIRSEVDGFLDKMEGGRTPGELIESARCFPDVFVSLYRSGEESGRLDENLDRLKDRYRDEGMLKLRTFSVWFPRLIYLLILAAVAVRIVSFYSGLFDSVYREADF